MIDLKSVITVSAVILLLNACDSVIDSNIVDFSEISVAAHSGIDAGLDGTYTTGCYLGGSGTVNEDLRIRGNTWNYTINDFASSDCSTVPTAGTISGTFIIDGVDIGATWVDGAGGTTTAPLAAIGDGSFLNNPESVTPLLITIFRATGSLAGTSGTSSFFYVVDDTGEDNVLYRDWQFDLGAVVVASTSAPYKETNVNLTEIFVAAHSATDAGLNGTYSTGCYAGGVGSINEGLVILGNKWGYTITEYSTSVDCTTGPTAGTISGTFKIDGTAIPITGWVDNSGNSVFVLPDTADTTDDPALTLSATEPVTPLLLNISNATGSLFGNSGSSSFFFVVDDTGVNNILYRDWDFDGGATTAGDFNPYTKQ
jgi:hypothetical protein